MNAPVYSTSVVAPPPIARCPCRRNCSRIARRPELDNSRDELGAACWVTYAVVELDRLGGKINGASDVHRGAASKSA